jgi:hypothetical protein
MHKIISSIIYWYFSTVKKFFGKLPWSSIKVVCISLVAQISMLLASILPIKVVLLLGSSHIPSYFPSEMQAMPREQLIIGLSVASVFFFLLYIVAQKITSFYVVKGAGYLVRKSRKIALYRNQSSIAENAYASFLKSVTGIVFCILAFLLICMIYPFLSLLVVGYLLSTIAIVMVLYGVYNLDRQKIEENLTDILRAVSIIGFFVAFGFIVTDFLLPIEPPSLIFALLGLILTRQMLVIITTSIQSIFGIYKNRFQINALFFHGHVKNNVIRKQEKIFWSLFEPTRRIAWITAVLDDVLGVGAKRITAIWHQTGINNIIAFEVNAYCEGEKKLKSFLIKIFNHNHSSKAINDANLLKECDLSFVMLDFLGSTQVEQYHCHVFSYGPLSKVSAKKVALMKLEMTKTIMAYDPPKNFLDRYTRSHPALWQRINKDMIRRLALASNDNQLKQLRLFEGNIEEIVSGLSRLPVQLVFSNIPPDTFVYDEDHNVKMLSWGGWSFEPLGFGWPIEKDGIKNLRNVLDQIKSERSGLSSLSNQSVIMSAVLSTFEKRYNRQDFSRALELMPLIIESFKNMGKTASSPTQYLTLTKKEI